MKVELIPNHFNSKFYKDPTKYDPTRWQEKDVDPYILGGFGYGPHACLGKSLALLISKIITTIFLQRYDHF